MRREPASSLLRIAETGTVMRDCAKVFHSRNEAMTLACRFSCSLMQDSGNAFVNIYLYSDILPITSVKLASIAVLLRISTNDDENVVYELL